MNSDGTGVKIPTKNNRRIIVSSIDVKSAIPPQTPPISP